MAGPMPLQGIRVLDFTNVIAGPVATRVLCALGAEVIKVEPPWGRHILRGTARPLPGARPFNAIPSFNEVNRGKRSIAVDLTHPAGRDLVRRLVRVCDLVVENFAPRVMPNLGLTYEDLRPERPDLIYVSMPALGYQGPWKDFVAFGPGTEALAGLSDLTGYEDGPPLKPANFYADQNGAMHAVVAVLVALRHRRRTGRGQRLFVVLREAVQAVIGEFFLAWQMTGRLPRRQGNCHPWMAPHGVYPGREPDTWLALAVPDDPAFRRLCAEMGQPALAEDPRFADSLSRHRHQTALDEEVARWTRRHSPLDLAPRLQALGIPASAVLTAPEVVADPHWQARGFLERVEHPEMGPALHPTLPWRASRIPYPSGRIAPPYAQDNEAVLRDLLGLSPAEVQALKEQGAVVDHPRGEE